MEVGIRELRDHLSTYLKKVRGGEELVVTDRGRAVARVVALAEERSIDRLVAEGLVTPAKQARRSGPRRPIEADGSVTDLVTDQRR